MNARPLDEMSRRELSAMLDAIKRDADDYIAMGKMRAQKKLSNGAVVTVTIVASLIRGDGEP